MKLYKSIEEYSKENIVRFHMPGHKGKNVADIDLYKNDVTELPGFGDLHDPKSEVSQINESLQGLYDYNHAAFLINGSTSGIMTAVFALINPGDKVLIAKNSHKSIYNALMLRNAGIEYIDSKTDENGIFLPIRPEDVKKALENNKDVKLTIITSPTYEGVLSNIKDIKKTVNKYNIPLLVDGAHGAAMGIFEDVGNASVLLSGDVTITSLHKSLPFLTQTSCILWEENQYTKKGITEKIYSYLSCFETSSPSYVFMVQAQKALEFIENEGKTYYEKAKSCISHVKDSINSLNNISLFNSDDPFKLVLLSNRENGGDLINDMLNKTGIIPEMHTPYYCLLMSSIMNDSDDFKRLIEELILIDKALDNYPQKPENDNIFNTDLGIPEYAISMGEAILKNSIYVDVEKACGRISRGFVDIFPPGIPMLIPGEIIKNNHIDLVKMAKEHNINIRGLSENKVLVVE